MQGMARTDRRLVIQRKGPDMGTLEDLSSKLDIEKMTWRIYFKMFLTTVEFMIM